MNQIIPYLNFNGNCREVFQFYADCLGAALTIQTVAESPIAAQFPESMHGQVVHAALAGSQGILLMGSDMCGPDGWVAGNNFSLSYSCTEEEIHQLFAKLAAGGHVMEAVKRQFWGDLFCAFTDKWGTRWTLNAPVNNAQPTFEVLRFSTQINATREKVWEILLEDEYYRQWTAAFHPGSFAEGDWKEGSKVYFKTPEGDGMVSRVVEHRPASKIYFEHQGVLHNNEEMPDHPEGNKWKGAREIYIVEDVADGTLLQIEVDVTPEYAGFMKTSWEQALQTVRSLAEKAAVVA